jgi:hypothetical protein
VSEELKEEVEDVINPIEIAILRIKLRLGNLVRERERCGTQPGDAIETAEIAEIAEIAGVTLKLCEKLGDESALVRVSFWVGIVFFYNNNIQQARSYFQKANIPEVLPEYEITYIAGWLQRCNESSLIQALQISRHRRPTPHKYGVQYAGYSDSTEGIKGQCQLPL